jgi:hypothetical protein
MRFIKFTPEGMTVLESDSSPSLNELLSLLSSNEQQGEIIDYLQNRLGDPALVILCPVAENLPLTAIDATQKELFGNLLIFAKARHVCGYDLDGLTRNQIASVRQELRLARAIASHQEPESADDEQLSEMLCGGNKL